MKKVFKGIRFVLRILGYATLFSFLGLLLAFLSIELFLRVFYKPGRRYYHPDPKVGWICEHCTRKAGFNFSYIANSYGVRGKEYSMRKPVGTFRIVVLGDSFVEGWGVLFEKTFHQRLKEKLRKMEELKIEVLGFGMPGYGTLHEYLFFKHIVLKFHPNLVILSFFLNDFTDNYPLTTPTNLGPIFDIAYTPELKTIQGYQQWLAPSFTHFLYSIYTIRFIVSHIGWLSDDSLLNSFLWRLNLVNYYYTNEYLIKAILRDPKIKYKSWPESILYTPKYVETNPLGQELYQTTFALLKLFKEICQQQHLPLLLLYQPTEFETEVINLQNLPQPRKTIVDYHPDPFYPAEKLRSFAHKNNILFLDPIANFVHAYHQTGKLPYLPDGHYNEEGHAIVAQALYEYLLQHNLVPVKK